MRAGVVQMSLLWLARSVLRLSMEVFAEGCRQLSRTDSGVRIVPSVGEVECVRRSSRSSEEAAQERTERQLPPTKPAPKAPWRVLETVSVSTRLLQAALGLIDCGVEQGRCHALYERLTAIVALCRGRRADISFMFSGCGCHF